MKICQDISQEMAKLQQWIDNFKANEIHSLIGKITMAKNKEEIEKLQQELFIFKEKNWLKYEKQQQKLKALSMNFQGELAKELGLNKREYKARYDKDKYLRRLHAEKKLSEADLSETKITELTFHLNEGTKTLKTLKTEFLPKDLQKLSIGAGIDLFETNLSETKITELNFHANTETKTLKTEFLPKGLQILDISDSEIDLSETNLSEIEIIELDFYRNEGTKTLNFNYLPLTLKNIRIKDSLLLKKNLNIVQELKTFFKKRGQRVRIGVFDKLTIY